MAMRSMGSYAYCEECDKLFAPSPDDSRGIIRHPTFDQWGDMN